MKKMISKKRNRRITAVSFCMLFTLCTSLISCKKKKESNIYAVNITTVDITNQKDNDDSNYYILLDNNRDGVVDENDIDFEESSDASSSSSRVSVTGTALFSSGVTGKIYYEYEKGVDKSVQREQFEKDAKKIELKMSEELEKYHVLFDRHYYYVDKNTNKIVQNLRVLNNYYGKNEVFKFDSDIFYTAIKEALRFTKVSEGYFSVGLGELTDLYSSYIGNAFSLEHYMTSLNGMQTNGNALNISENVPEEKKNKALICTPTYDSWDQVLEFNETDKTVKFNSYSGRDGTSSDCKVSLSLSAYGKGLAIEKFVSSVEDRALMLSGGTSSIKTSGFKDSTQEEPWNVRFLNPIHRELSNLFGLGFVQRFDKDNNPIDFLEYNKYNDFDIYYTTTGQLNLSTSGYSENYFYYPVDEYGNEVEIPTISPVYVDITNEEGYADLTVEESKDLLIQRAKEKLIEVGTDLNNYLRKIKDVKRVSHIVNPNDGNTASFFDTVTVNLNDTGLADMYTTALMATNSKEELFRIKELLDKEYNVESEVIFSYKEGNLNVKPALFEEVPTKIYIPIYETDNVTGKFKNGFVQLIMDDNSINDEVYSNIKIIYEVPESLKKDVKFKQKPEFKYVTEVRYY